MKKRSQAVRVILRQPFLKYMSNTVPSRRWLLYSFAAITCLSSASIPLHGDETAVELTSPKNDDHFDVTQPLLFWTSTPAAQKYEIYIDDAKVAEVPAAPIPVLHYSVAQPLPPGKHHWSIKAILPAGDAVTSITSTFTIDPRGIGPHGLLARLNDTEKTHFCHPRETLGKQSTHSIPAWFSTRDNSACFTGRRAKGRAPKRVTRKVWMV